MEGAYIARAYFYPYAYRRKKYSSKRILAKKVLEELKGKLRIVDPYCGERTLDVLKDISNRTVMFLTRLALEYEEWRLAKCKSCERYFLKKTGRAQFYCSDECRYNWHAYQKERPPTNKG